MAEIRRQGRLQRIDFALPAMDCRLRLFPFYYAVFVDGQFVLQVVDHALSHQKMRGTHDVAQKIAAVCNRRELG